MKKIKLLTIIGLLIAMLTACGGSSIVGRWESDNSYFDELEFFSDGTYDSNDPNYNGSYSAENGRLRLGGVLMPDKTYSYDVSGSKLTLYNNDGEVYAEYKKVN